MGREKQSTFGLFHSAWFVCLLGLGGVLYAAAMQHKASTYEEMALVLRTLEARKEATLQAHDDLVSQIHSQSDPAWVEMTLKRNLGMVSEGQIKVYFE